MKSESDSSLNTIETSSETFTNIESTKEIETEIPIDNDFFAGCAINLDNTQDVLYEDEELIIRFKIPYKWSYGFVSRNYPDSDISQINLFNEDHDQVITFIRTRGYERLYYEEDYPNAFTIINNKKYYFLHMSGVRTLSLKLFLIIKRRTQFYWTMI